MIIPDPACPNCGQRPMDCSEPTLVDPDLVIRNERCPACGHEQERIVQIDLDSPLQPGLGLGQSVIREWVRHTHEGI
jgi:hypothetical protein